ncbi:MAG TPA: hypothetical protein DDW19_04935 [Anaerolineaceae bacterium]|nr:hypothetical protein [Anaerolineaceae bacterium]
MKKKLLYPLLFIVPLLLSACSTLQDLLPSPPQQSGDILYADDFSNPRGWGSMGRSGGSIQFEYEGLLIKVDTPNFLFWTVNGNSYQDVKIDVDAVLLSGPTNDNFGAICRFKDNGNFYGFVISHDGYFGIFKSIEGVITPLMKPEGMQYSEVIRQGGIVNHIQVVCQGSTLTMSVNGEELASIGDPDLQEGKFGLIAGAYDQPGVNILFDNLLIVQP